MVKVCSKCGIVNTERARVCESCGAELGAPIENSEADKMSEQIAKRNEKTKKSIEAEKFGGPDENYPQIPVTPFRKITGITACVAAAGVAALMVLSFVSSHEFAQLVFLTGIPALLLLVIAVLHCFLPGKMWAMSHFMDRLYYKEMPLPSDIGLFMQCVSIVFCVLFGIAVLAFQILLLCGVINFG